MITERGERMCPAVQCLRPGLADRANQIHCRSSLTGQLPAALGGVAAVEAAEVSRAQDAEDEHAEAEGDDVGRAPQVEIADAADEHIEHGEIENAPQQVHRLGR